jgi:hypothetical protein
VLALRFVSSRALFPECLALSFLEAYIDPYHPPFLLFSDIGCWHLRAGSVATPVVEVPMRYVGVSEYDLRLAYQCILIVLEAQVRFANCLREENFILKHLDITEAENQDLLVLASGHPALAGVLFVTQIIRYSRCTIVSPI